VSWESAIPRVYDAAVNDRATPIHCALIAGPIEDRDAAQDHPIGADVVFLGRTRPEEHETHGPLLALEYEAHEAIAPRIMREICEELLEEFGLAHVSMVHATGRIALGEASLRLRVCAPHRAEAIAAVAAGIDRLKTRVPIWKCECWQGGRTWSTGKPLLGTEASA